MSSAATNPYATTNYDHVTTRELASLGERFAAKVVDNMAGVGTLTPGVVGMLIIGGPEAAEQDPVAMAIMVVGLLMTLGLMVALAITQWVWLATRGQTVGKRAMHIHVIKMDDTPVDFASAVLLRSWLPGFVIGIANQLCLGWIIGLVDIAPIFGAERRCVHDMIANTKVVVGHPAFVD